MADEEAPEVGVEEEVPDTPQAEAEAPADEGPPDADADAAAAEAAAPPVPEAEGGAEPHDPGLPADMTAEEADAALEEAKKLNEQLKKMVMAEDSGAISAPQASAAPAPAGKLTFSGPPHVPRAKPHARVNYTFHEPQLVEIGRENQILVQKLTRITNRQTKKMPAGYVPPERRAASEAPSAINRRKAADRIAQENLALYKRLQKVKPSTELNRKKLERDFGNHEKFRANCSQFRRPEWQD